MPRAKNSLRKSSLKYSTIEGSYWGVMYGAGEAYLRAFFEYLKYCSFQIAFLTTFRFFIDDPEIKSVKVNIYNASGYLIEDNLINDNEIIPFEFNEIFWDASGIDSGLYFAEIKSTPGKSELVRLLIIK